MDGRKADQLQDLAADLVNLKVRYYRRGGAAAARAVQQTTRTIPVSRPSPILSGQGLSQTWQAYGNITGLSILGTAASG